jgi:hypothetical protein
MGKSLCSQERTFDSDCFSRRLCGQESATIIPDNSGHRMSSGDPVEVPDASAPPVPVPWWGFGILLIPIAMSVMFCWGPTQRLRSAYLEQAWPAADATILSGQVTFRNQPRIGKRSPWTGWCVSWTYAYPWNGGKIGGTLEDSTPSTLAPGCFSYRESAERQAARRPAGGVVRVRIDPADPWASTTDAAGIRGGDVVLLLLGLLPGASSIYLAGAEMRRRQQRRIAPCEGR